MPVTIIRLRDCAPQPWKNGLGRTREIAAETAGTGGGFLWRVSVAEVDSAAPFSRFPGVDRQIVLLDGAGFRMNLGDGRRHALCTPFEPFAFPGETAVQVELVGGATTDFNLMVRRAAAHGAVETWRADGPHALDHGIALVYCARGHIDTVDGTLHAGDSWRPAPGIAAPGITLRDGAVALAVRIELRAG